jgi:preprotein translocase subunit SecG
MISFLLVLFLMACFALVVTVLLQAGKGGGLAAGFGGSGTGFELLGGRQTATFLHQATRWLGGAFLAIAFLIALLTARGNRPQSLLEREFEGQPQPVQQESGTPQDLESVVGGAESGAAGATGGEGATSAAAPTTEGTGTPQPPAPGAPAPTPQPAGTTP